DTIQVILRKNPVVTLPDDTAICEGLSVTLNAGDDGITYFWNTGATTQEITVNASGTYVVLVTNAAGCTAADTTLVIVDGLPPTIDGILITNNGGHTFTFNALNPQNVVGYDWDFGDGSPHSNQQVPTHTYDDIGDYVVTLTVTSGCGDDSDSVSAHIVGIGGIDLDNDALSLYPNPAKEQATLKATGVVMQQITVYN